MMRRRKVRAVIGNCGFGIVPSPPHLRDLIMRNLAVDEGMDLDALRAGIDWRFQSFAEYMVDAAWARRLHEPRRSSRAFGDAHRRNGR